MNNIKTDSDFVWVDLSTFDIAEAKKFYSAVFGWKYKEDNGYQYAQIGAKQVSALFLMPEYLQKINMPSFWMSYISVNDASETVKAAKKVEGVIVEVEPFDFAGGKAALIRDPSGAGFTVYDGPELQVKSNNLSHGNVVWNELIVDSIENVRSFYETVFGFKITTDTSYDGERYKVSNTNGTYIAGIEVLPEDQRGSKVYWLVLFAVKNISEFSNLIERNGGKKDYESSMAIGKIALYRDTQDAVFAVLETGKHSMWQNGFKFRTAAALIIIAAALLFNVQWIWGVLFLLWLIPDLLSGTTYLLEPIHRKSNPVLYWLLILVWASLAMYFFIPPAWY